MAELHSVGGPAPLDLKETLERGRWQEALFLTYSFDLPFFESYLLPILGFPSVWYESHGRRPGRKGMRQAPRPRYHYDRQSDVLVLVHDCGEDAVP